PTPDGLAAERDSPWWYIVSSPVRVRFALIPSPPVCSSASGSLPPSLGTVPAFLGRTRVLQGSVGMSHPTGKGSPIRKLGPLSGHFERCPFFVVSAFESPPLRSDSSRS